MVETEREGESERTREREIESKTFCSGCASITGLARVRTFIA